MRIGLFALGTEGIEAFEETARWAESAGLATVWVAHVPWSIDALTALAFAGRATERIELGSAVMNTHSRHPLAMAQQALTTQAACGGRLTLGLGPSHRVVIEQGYGLSYDRPARHVREYLDVLEAAFAGTGSVDHDGEVYRVHSPFQVPGARPVPVMLAALAPLMLRLAGERTGGTITWMTDRRALAEHIVPRITAAAEAAGRPAPRVVAGVPVAVCDDPDAARERAAELFALYGTVEAYQRVLALGDADGPAGVAVVGDEAAVERQLRSYAEAGATDLSASVFPVGPHGDASRRRTLDLLASLAPEL